MVLQFTKKPSLTSHKHDSRSNTYTLQIEAGGTWAILYRYSYLTSDIVAELTVCGFDVLFMCVYVSAVAEHKLFPTPNTRGNRLVYIP